MNQQTGLNKSNCKKSSDTGAAPVNIHGAAASRAQGSVIVHAMGVAVVGLGAWSELAHRGHQGIDVHVREFAVLDDGRRLTLRQDRGFSTSATHLTADHAKRSVLATVLPDDAEVSGEDHPWERLASMIAGHGVAVTPEQLKRLPYAVEFGPRLSALLGPEQR